MAQVLEKENVVIDNSYNIREYEVDDSWKKDLYSNEKYVEYRNNWDAATNDYKLFDDPLFLEVETSYACNYKCPFCPQVTLPEIPTGGLMKQDVLDKILNEVEERQIPSMALSHGGEPLIRKDIPQIISRLREAGALDRMFHTNAYLLKKELSEAVIEAGLTKINFSLDAITPDTYDKVRIGGNYDLVIGNIMDFLELKKKFGKSYPRTRVSFVVTEANKHEMQGFYDFWKDKVNLIAFQQEYDFSTFDEENFNKMKNEIMPPCSLLWQHLSITHEGDITCECDYNHDNVIGNVKTLTLHNAWNGPEINLYRELHKQNKWCEIKMCQKCVNRVSQVSESENELS